MSAGYRAVHIFRARKLVDLGVLAVVWGYVFARAATFHWVFPPNGYDLLFGLVLCVGLSVKRMVVGGFPAGGLASVSLESATIAYISDARYDLQKTKYVFVSRTERQRTCVWFALQPVDDSRTVHFRAFFHEHNGAERFVEEFFGERLNSRFRVVALDLRIYAVLGFIGLLVVLLLARISSVWLLAVELVAPLLCVAAATVAVEVDETSMSFRSAFQRRFARFSSAKIDFGRREILKRDERISLKFLTFPSFFWDPLLPTKDEVMRRAVELFAEHARALAARAANPFRELSKPADQQSIGSSPSGEARIGKESLHSR